MPHSCIFPYSLGQGRLRWALILPVLLTMAMNFGKVLVGIVIVAIPTLPII